MFWFCVWQVVSTLIELIRLGRRSESDKDLEILLLRRQLAIYERRQERAPHLSRGEKLTLMVLGTKLKEQTGRTIKAMGEVIRIVKPATLFGWHKRSCGANGPIAIARQVVRGQTKKSSNSCYAWHAKTTGVMNALKANCSNWGTPSVMRRWATFCNATGSRLHRNVSHHPAGVT